MTELMIESGNGHVSVGAFRPRVVVVGAGASGTLLTIALLAAAETPIDVVLVERAERAGPGLAYRTSDTQHLLNSPAGHMSAVAARPDDFVRWAERAGEPVDPAGFPTRGVYGRYLSAALASAVERSTSAVDVVTGTSVVDILPGERSAVVLDTGTVVRADAVVLAVGANPDAPAGPSAALSAWEDDLDDVGRDGRPVLIMGTGLSMVDVALTVTARHPDTRVRAISRHGLLPRPHLSAPRRSGPGARPASRPSWRGGGDLDLNSLARSVRRAAASSPCGWQGVVDAVRSDAPDLWRRLRPDDRQRFVERFGRYWDIHRHRMAPAVAERVDALQRAGRLRVDRGRIVGIETGPAGVCARVGTAAGHEVVRAATVVDCTGTRRPDPLTGCLIARGLLRRDPLGLGLDADADGRLVGTAGRAHRTWTTLGPPRQGCEWESTAVPEIRAQATALAALLLRPAPVL